ncbi:MAG TPA: tRNA (adenosine(37)-N6)-threonylcarbamoyltransferase complex ATPase subunit type 1 TsaE [Tepidisphaeraceae bacterium]|nr:tRNA (adenosine(37)-N6)-threonylcarbamoyltransferase complex ATPase subunit type 1 TsaE [Tepidisphaeraceae bacterium]
MRFERVSNSVEETEGIAGEFARGLPGGSVVALAGEMGAGKTQFVRGMVLGLGGNRRMVSSPTFTLLNIYPTASLTVFHLDAYRTAGADDLEGIGFLELLEQGGVVVVEWPSRVESLLPASTLRVEIVPLDETTRRIALPF